MNTRFFIRISLPMLACVAGVVPSGCRRAESAPPRPVAVRVEPATAISEGCGLHLSGTIEAERSINLSFAVPGTVLEVLVDAGVAVSEGQLLARLDARSFQDSADLAQAKTDQAQDAWRRFAPMHRNGTVPEIKWVEIDTGLRQAKLALSIARKTLGDTVLRAPESGVIAKRVVEPGTNVLPGVPVLVLVQSRTMLATGPIPERAIASIRMGQSARVRVDALGKTFAGAVREIGVTADVLTRTYSVKIAVPNPDGELKVGMVAGISLAPSREAVVVTLPPESVRLDDQGRTCVYVLSPNHILHRRPVVVSGYVGERLAIADGITAGDRVVVSGTSMLADGISAVEAGTTGES